MKKYQTLTKVLGKPVVAMAYPRDKWIDKMSGSLTGAFGEWCKQRLSEQTGFKGHDWNPEVNALLRTARRLLLGEIKTKSRFKIKTLGVRQ